MPSEALTGIGLTEEDLTDIATVMRWIVATPKHATRYRGTKAEFCRAAHELLSTKYNADYQLSRTLAEDEPNGISQGKAIIAQMLGELRSSHSISTTTIGFAAEWLERDQTGRPF